MKKTALITLLGLAMVGTASAQSRSSFSTPTSWTGINITNNGAKNWTVQLTGTPTVTINDATYNVKDVFGFWLLDDNNDMTAQGQSFNGWSYHQNYSGTGGIAGYKTNPNTGITPGTSQQFTFDAVNGSIENVGIHARLELNGVSNTLYLDCPPPAVPEPASIAALGIGAAAMVRRRKKQ